MRVSLERLRELLTYDLETGEFRWRFNHAPRARAGQVAGAKDSKGYIQIKIDGTLHLAHRLAWLYVHGAWPDDELDHRDGVPTNNRIGNLRACIRHENNENIGRRRDNTSGYVGVHWDGSVAKWKASITKHGHRYLLGCFTEKSAAYEAYLAAKQRLHEFQPVPRYELLPDALRAPNDR